MTRIKGSLYTRLYGLPPGVLKSLMERDGLYDAASYSHRELVDKAYSKYESNPEAAFRQLDRYESQAVPAISQASGGVAQGGGGPQPQAGGLGSHPLFKMLLGGLGNYDPVHVPESLGGAGDANFEMFLGGPPIYDPEGRKQDIERQFGEAYAKEHGLDTAPAHKEGLSTKEALTVLPLALAASFAKQRRPENATAIDQGINAILQRKAMGDPKYEMGLANAVRTKMQGYDQNYANAMARYNDAWKRYTWAQGNRIEKAKIRNEEARIETEKQKAESGIAKTQAETERIMTATKFIPNEQARKDIETQVKLGNLEVAWGKLAEASRSNQAGEALDRAEFEQGVAESEREYALDMDRLDTDKRYKRRRLKQIDEELGIKRMTAEAALKGAKKIGLDELPTELIPLHEKHVRKVGNEITDDPVFELYKKFRDEGHDPEEAAQMVLSHPKFKR